MSSERLRTLIEHDGIQRNKVFTLSSGGSSDIYFDGKRITIEGEGIFLVANQMIEIIQTSFPTARAVGGMSMGANFIVPVIIAQAYQREYPLTHGFIVYKEDGQVKVAHPPHDNTDVVIVDDTTSTGNSLDLGTFLPHCHIVGGVVILDRSDGEAEKRLGFPVKSLYTLDDFEEN